MRDTESSSGSHHPSLRRELPVFSATMLGLGSIIGTGVFVSLGIAAGIAGAWMLIALVLAGLLASCNALSSAQLAAAFPVSGGTYEYGYRCLHPLAGFTAGWMFVWAKCASAATAALGLAIYLPDLDVFASRGLIAVLLVVCMTLLVLAGLRRASTVNTVIVLITLTTLGVFVLGGVVANEHPLPLFAESPERVSPSVLHATALMFVAYTGYGRIATLGEEIQDPRRTIPRAIISTIVITIVLYVAVAFVALRLIGPGDLYDAAVNGLERTGGPLHRAAFVTSWEFLPEVVAIGAITAMAGVLLNLLLGVSRVLLAMARRDDMPRVMARLNRTRTTPTIAVVVTGGLIVILTLIGDIRVAWSLSALTVLIYYGLTNLAALRLTPEHRLYPRFVSWIGCIGCFGLVFWIDARVMVASVLLIGLGMAWYLGRRLLRVANDEG